MSITNGERLVTKQDLADMYQGILPYLGGMPEMVANKFSKGDLYSTDEKMIGQWINGKPLYQKVITGLDTLINSSSWNTLCTIPDLDLLIGGYALYNNTGTSKLNVVYFRELEPSDNVIKAQFSGNARTINIAVLQYTKTTDSAISIGETTEYSTDEKVVGTWIDGRPIWQKTIDYGALPNSTTKDVAHGISNIDTIISYLGHTSDSTGTVLMLPFANVTGTVNQIQISATKSNVRIVTGIDRSSFNRTYITIQYTKAT